MDINITGRNIDLDDTLKEYVHKKLDRLERLYRRIYDCEVVLEEEKDRRNAEIILYLKRTKLVAKESSPDIYASIDLAADAVKKQIRRLSGRLGSRRRKAMMGRIMNPVSIFRGGEETDAFREPSDIVKMNSFADKPMLPEEAKLELDMLDKEFMMFKNADTGEVNVIYKRNDGKFGLIEPNF